MAKIKGISKKIQTLYMYFNAREILLMRSKLTSPTVTRLAEDFEGSRQMVLTKGDSVRRQDRAHGSVRRWFLHSTIASSWRLLLTSCVVGASVGALVVFATNTHVDF